MGKFRVTGWTSSSLGGDELPVKTVETGQNQSCGFLQQREMDGFKVKTCSATFCFGESTKNIHLTSVDASSPKN